MGCFCTYRAGGCQQQDQPYRVCSAAFQATWEERDPKRTQQSWVVRDFNLTSCLEMGGRDVVSFWTLGASNRLYQSGKP